MAHWNHRVVQRVVGDGIKFGIHEVFYDNDGMVAYTEKPVNVCGETLEELRETVNRMLRCLDSPVIVDGDIEFPYKLSRTKDRPGIVESEVEFEHDE